VIEFDASASITLYEYNKGLLSKRFITTLWREEMMGNKYDAIIIGTGIGGAAIGALLAHAGWDVLILEKNKIIGGRCTSYEHNGFIIDLGVHLFGLGDKGPLGEICCQVEMPNAIDWVTIKKAVMQIEGEIKKYSRKSMMDVLAVEEAKNLNNLFKELFRMSDQELDELWYVPLNRWVSRFTKDPLAHTIMESIEGLYFYVRLNEASTAEFIKCFREVITSQSSAYPKGGCISIPKAYISAVEKYGGKIKLGVRVAQVIVEGGAAVGVRLEDGSEFEAPVIISNADIKTTVENLVGEKNFPEEYAQKIKNLTYAYHGVTLKVALTERITEDELRMYMPDRFSSILSGLNKGKNGEIPKLLGGFFVSPTNYDSSLAPEGRQLIFFCTACPPKQDWKKWGKVLLESFYSAYPQAKDKVLWHRVDTPDLVNAYAGETGCGIGIGQTVNQVSERRPSVTSPLRGLYFSSGEAGGHGIGTELAANSARELFAVLSSQ